MAGFVITHDGDEFGFHTDTGFPRNIAPERIKEIQLDCDELQWALKLWPEADLFAYPGRVRVWKGASARRLACKFLEEQIVKSGGTKPSGGLFDGWDSVHPTAECLHCHGTGLAPGDGTTECGFCA
jgi:hypothetical protein